MSLARNISFNEILEVAKKQGHFDVKKNIGDSNIKAKCDSLVRKGHLWRGKDTKKSYHYVCDKKEQT